MAPVHVAFIALVGLLAQTNATGSTRGSNVRDAVVSPPPPTHTVPPTRAPQGTVRAQ